MSRLSICKACHNEKHGIKTRISQPHTCEKPNRSLEVVCSCRPHAMNLNAFTGKCLTCGKPV